MNKESLKQLIVETVESVQGCKATELFSRPEIAKAFVLSNSNPAELLDELVKEKKLVEVAYSLSTMPYRCKSFLLPANTEIIRAEDGVVEE